MLDISPMSKSTVLEEHDYIGLSQVASAAATSLPLEETEDAPQDTDLRLDLGLGLGYSSGFTKKVGEGEQKRNHSTPQLDSIHASVSGGLGSSAPKNSMKRGFSETVAMPAPKTPEVDSGLSKQSSFFLAWAPPKPTIPGWHAGRLDKSGIATPPKPFGSTEILQASVPEEASPSKDRVVGWPPVRSYRRQALVKPAESFVKVNMDGMTVGRKVDLNVFASYESLLLALEDMFQPSSSVQVTSQASLGRDSDVKHFLLANGSDFVLTYEDKEGDWMLVGDVPWSMFVSTVRRLRITRGSEATGSGSRALGKSRLHL